jgi:hemerythrin
MAFFEWINDLSTGVNAMDDEHKKLIDIMNRLHTEAKANAGLATLRATVDELAKYTKKHFADEEVYLEKIKFDKLDIHKRIHADLLEKFGAHIKEFESTGKLTDAFFKFLQLWLSAHIRGIDKQYGPYRSQVKAA